jgi:hypothetical protein
MIRMMITVVFLTALEAENIKIKVAYRGSILRTVAALIAFCDLKTVAHILPVAFHYIRKKKIILQAFYTVCRDGTSVIAQGAAEHTSFASDRDMMFNTIPAECMQTATHHLGP